MVMMLQKHPARAPWAESQLHLRDAPDCCKHECSSYNMDNTAAYARQNIPNRDVLSTYPALHSARASHHPKDFTHNCSNDSSHYDPDHSWEATSSS